MGPVGMPELVIILVIILLLFGSSKIPQLMRGLGQGIHEFKKGIHEGDKESQQAKEAQPTVPPIAPPPSPEEKAKS